MSQVDEHPEAVHFVNDRSAEIVDPVILGVIGRAVGELVVLEMGEGHVARAKVVELAQGREIAADLVAAFDPDQRFFHHRIPDFAVFRIQLHHWLQVELILEGA